MSQFPSLTMRERLTGIAEEIGFVRAEHKYLKKRLTELNSTSRKKAETFESLRAPHVVIVPNEGETFASFAPNEWNVYYQAAQSLREELGETSVSVFHVSPGEDAPGWHRRLIDFVISSDATHIMGHVESDPGQSGASWTWDVLWSELSEVWDGVFLGVMFDSSYKWLTAQTKLLARISPNFLLVDICVPMDGSLVRGRPEVGPINMPISRQTINLLDERLESVEKHWDVSFVGAMYPYRVDLIAKLRSMGIDVAVNPHRADHAEDFATSRSDQPSWLDYMAGLASSRMTLNFSQSSAGRYVQLKTRVLEAGLAGALLLTDDLDRTSRFFVQDEEYGYFQDVEALPSVIAEYLSAPERLESIAAAGARRARQLAPTAFWYGIDAGLKNRRLRPIF